MQRVKQVREECIANVIFRQKTAKAIAINLPQIEGNTNYLKHLISSFSIYDPL